MKNYFMSFIILVVFSCKTNSTAPGEDLEALHWNDISIEQVYYDSLDIGSKNMIFINGRSVESIVLFELENNEYVPKDTIIPTYSRTGDGYYLNFQFHRKVSKEIIHYKFKLIYKISGDRFFEIDNTHLMLRYPYKSAQLFLTADDVWKEYEITFQDIDLNNDFLFFHPAGPYGLYKYNLHTKETEELKHYFGGDCIAYDSIYVFTDITHEYIDRYNLELDTVDLRVDLEALNIGNISGMDYYNGFIYVVYSDTYGRDFLAHFDLDGNNISSTPFLREGYYLAIDSGIAYSQAWESVLYRFNLLTNKNLPAKNAPVYHGGGFRIYKGRFYFVDWDKRAIGWIPFSEIQ